MANLTGKERTDALYLIRPYMDNEAVDTTIGDWVFFIKDEEDTLDDDTGALVQITEGDTLSQLADAIEVEIPSADMPAPGTYRWRLDRTLNGKRRTWGPYVFRVTNV